ncbi:CidA/LrgA family protein [Staphylococcus warneri]|jgi:holin-like protein|uniref:Holin-like protein CidA n=4 Tax=Bacteria TaxID=2 RepID=A0A2V3ZCX6_STAWA|nr:MULTISPECIES: CidA/LrgA family protein [Staphylococcus]ERH70301.1 holin [Acinetobacter baumannii EGD-HP18]MBJ7886923.1 CidA/LrgA family protein [Bacillaceae bacterium HSR45]MCC8989792.1 CidA/LrgA family protein [Staphylococcus sp.]MCR4455986.1 CidA/LrgA family protein [Aeromonas salmonicida]QAV30505.1 CidA/LrgA family protein [Sulfitobacter donghicola]COQ60599.1 LrgA protein family (control of murein hydrolase activity) [Streptococcus pneumoniae]CQA12520.1 Holin-like protein CidA [Mycobac
MHKVRDLLQLFVQIILILLISYIGTEVQRLLHIPLAGSIVGLLMFYLLLQFKIIPVSWVDEGANFLLKTMVFFFIPSVVGVMNVASDITLNYILFFLIIILGTCLVALSSGYIAETLVKRDDVGKGTDEL